MRTLRHHPPGRPTELRNLPIYATQFLLTAALGVVFVFLEDVQTRFGLADWEIGVIAGTGFGASLLAQMLLSPLADRGRVTLLAVVALIAGVLGPLGFAFGETTLVIAASRGATGVAMGLFGLVARKALIGLDATGGGAKLGVLLSFTVAGFVFGPLIGALLEPLGFEAPFIVVSLVLLAVGVPATATILRAPIAAASVDYGDLQSLVRSPRIQAAMAVQVIVFGFIGIFDATIDRYLTDLGATTTMVAVVIVCVGAPMLVLPRIAGELSERHGGGAVMLPALFALVPAVLGYGVASALLAATVFGVLHGVGESFASVGAQVLALEVTGPERAAIGSALLEAAGLSAATVAAFAGPVGYGSLGADVFLVAGALGVALGIGARWRLGRAKMLTPAAP